MNNNEKATTDDEREALRGAVVSGTETYAEAQIPGTYVSQYITDAVLAAGFRRPEVPEPSAHRATLIREAREHVDHYRRFDDTESLVSTLVEMSNALESAPEPQGEPTDAQVKAAVDAWYSSKRYRSSEGMRAALRAAWGVR